MNDCRNCGAQSTQDLGFIGQIAPFFLKRVLNLELGFAPSGHPVKQLLRKLRYLDNIVSKTYGKSVLINLRLCRECSFVQTHIPFSEQSLKNLYADYRSDSYNKERIRYEPTYSSIMPHLGNGEEYLTSRVQGLTEWLRSWLPTDTEISMLDYGGADGRFLPKLRGTKHVFEISDIPSSPGVVRIMSQEYLQTYDYVQLAHVLEHVSFPLALTITASSYLKPSGFLYVEVPQELSDEEFANLADGDRTI